MSDSTSSSSDNGYSELRFPCHVCSATFVTKHSLSRHMILHEDERSSEEEEAIEPQHVVASLEEGSPFLRQSTMSTSTRSILKQEFRRAAAVEAPSATAAKGQPAAKRPVPGLKPLPSLIPAEDFNIQLNRLQVNHTHNQQQQLLKEEPLAKKFQCQICNIYYAKKEDLARHVTRTHNTARFTCPYCSRNISRRDHLKRHIKNVHPEYCTDTEIGPFLANPYASRTAKEQHAENFAIHQRVSLKVVSQHGHRSSSNKRMRLSVDNSTPSSSPECSPNNNNNNNGITDNNEEEEELEGEFGGSLEETLDLSMKQHNHHNNNNNNNNGTDESADDDDNDNYQEMILGSLELPTDLSMGGSNSRQATIINNPESDVEEEGTMMLISDEDNPTAGVEANATAAAATVSSTTTNSSSSSIVRKFKCEFCDAAFLSKINMQRHMSTHSIIRPHKCNVCGKGFLRKEHLSKHLSSVHSGLKYKCQFCGKDISRKDHLLRHIRNCHPVEFMGMPPDMIDSEPMIVSNHENLKNNPMKVVMLSCDMCPETFSHVDELHEHQASIHSDIRKFKCDNCPKAFKRKEHLTKHLLTHAPQGQKSFTCNSCGKSFSKLETVQEHIRQVHLKSSAAAAARTAQEIFSCNLCDGKFEDRTILIAHLKEYHGVCNLQSRGVPPTTNTTATRQASPQQQPMRRGLKGQGKMHAVMGYQVPVRNKMEEGSLGSLMGLINNGSLSLSRVVH